MAILQIPITKSKQFVEIETDGLPDEVYKEALLQGLKVLANRGQSKITKVTYPNPEEMKEAAQTKALATVEDIKVGKIKFTGGKAKKASGAVMTEARRLARNLVKDEMKRQGIKISHVEASEITKAANTLLDEDVSILEQAKVNLAEREKIASGEGAVLTKIASTIAISDKLVKKAEAKKVKDQLSAKQAGKTKPRAKQQPQANA